MQQAKLLMASAVLIPLALAISLVPKKSPATYEAYPIATYADVRDYLLDQGLTADSANDLAQATYELTNGYTSAKARFNSNLSTKDTVFRSWQESMDFILKNPASRPSLP